MRKPWKLTAALTVAIVLGFALAKLLDHHRGDWVALFFIAFLALLMLILEIEQDSA